MAGSTGVRHAVMGGALALFAGLVYAVLSIAIGGADWAGALLLVTAVSVLVLVPLSPSIAFMAICVAAPLVITLNRHAGPWGPGKITLYLLILLALVMGGLTWLHERPRRSYLGPAAGLLLLFVLYLGGHVAVSSARADAFEAFVNHTYHWPFLLLPLVLLRRRWQIRAVVLFFAGLGAVLALATVGLSVLAQDPVALLESGGRYQRVHLYFGTPNILGVFLAFSFFLMFYGVPTRDRVLRWLKIGASFLFLLAILFTFSRRTWAATALVLLFHYIWKRDWRIPLVLVVGAAALSGPLTEDVTERAESAFDMRDDSNLGRRAELTEQLRLLPGDGLSLLGWGIENARSAAGGEFLSDHEGLYFHNYYLTLYYLTGAIGTLLYLLLCAAIFFGLWRALRRAQLPDTRGALAAGMAVTVVLVIQGMAGTGNIGFPVNYVSALVAGLGFAAYAAERRELERLGDSGGGAEPPAQPAHAPAPAATPADGA